MRRVPPNAPRSTAGNGDLRNHAREREGMTDRYLQQVLAIRSLNDELRTRFRGGTISISDEVRELGTIVVAHALLALTESTTFDDPEHSTGHFAFCGRIFRWRISYDGRQFPRGASGPGPELLLWL